MEDDKRMDYDMAIKLVELDISFFCPWINIPFPNNFLFTLKISSCYDQKVLVTF